MTYELAKQLKDAGFPQNPMVTVPGRYLYDDSKALLKPTAVYAPTLSELISALGDNFGGINHYPYESNNKFRAYSRNGISKELYGQTPEEAVAKLWLALNKK